MAEDVFRPYFGHPLLPAGINADDNNGDEVDGAGTNWEIWPELFDSFIGLQVMLVDSEMMAVFDTGFPDYAPPCIPNTIVFDSEVRTQVIRRRA